MFLDSLCVSVSLSLSPHTHNIASIFICIRMGSWPFPVSKVIIKPLPLFQKGFECVGTHKKGSFQILKASLSFFQAWMAVCEVALEQFSEQPHDPGRRHGCFNNMKRGAWYVRSLIPKHLLPRNWTALVIQSYLLGYM